MNETLSLSWDAYKNNICSGLSALQQRGEFVDMTLAADGHHVKVHQMVLSLVSPYIKELISTAQCPHPVIFLNNISYTTLSLILEYVYTGEAQVPKERLSDLIAAGKALHIKGLRDMDEAASKSLSKLEQKQRLRDKLQVPEHNKNSRENIKKEADPLQPMCEIFVNSDFDDVELIEECNNTPNTHEKEKKNNADISKILAGHKNNELSTTIGNTNVQYSLSNQGNMQVILNRYIYNLKYVQKNSDKYWRCVYYSSKKCPANVYTNNENMVVKRRNTHNHPFHDAKILKKMRLNLIFGTYKEAQVRALENSSKESLETVPSRQPQKSSSDSE